jgi:hypothetical protein
MERRMKFVLLFFVIASISILGLTTLAFGVCPEAPTDNGICDTMHVKVYPSDTLFSPFIQFPIFVTHDVLNPLTDSLAAFLIPLCYTHTNPTKYCSLTYYWNNYTSYTNPRSIFRHLVIDGDTIHNWMMDQFEEGNNIVWDGIVLDLDGTSHAFLLLVSSGSEDQQFGPETHRLLFTLTFKVKDTMTVCIDSCFWPPNDRLWFATEQTIYVPRHNLPLCVSLSYLLGDVNLDGTVNISDVLFVINYLYNAGVLFSPTDIGDVNCDQIVDIGDVVFLINYLFKGGPAPSC